MQPARLRQEYFLLVEMNNAKSMSSGEERGLLSRTAAGNRAYGKAGTVSSLALDATMKDRVEQ